MIMSTQNKSAIVTLVERTSRKLVLIHLNRDRTATAVGTGNHGVRRDGAADAPLADLGPRQRDGRPSRPHPRHQHAGLLLPEIQPLATRQQRKHEWAAARLPQSH
jgi:hypothetical protein